MFLITVFFCTDGFKKLVSTDHGGIKADNPEWEFHHQYFVQGKLDLLENIKRKVHNGYSLLLLNASTKQVILFLMFLTHD